MKIQEYVAKVVAAAPPLSAAQLDRIGMLLCPESRVSSAPAETPQQKELREAHAALDKIMDKYRELLGSCGICQLSPVAHRAQSSGSFVYHEFVPMTVDQIISASQSYKPEIQEAEDRLAKAQGAISHD